MQFKHGVQIKLRKRQVLFVPNALFFAATVLWYLIDAQCQVRPVLLGTGSVPEVKQDVICTYEVAHSSVTGRDILQSPEAGIGFATFAFVSQMCVCDSRLSCRSCHFGSVATLALESREKPTVRPERDHSTSSMLSFSQGPSHTSSSQGARWGACCTVLPFYKPVAQQPLASSVAWDSPSQEEPTWESNDLEFPTTISRLHERESTLVVSEPLSIATPVVVRCASHGFLQALGVAFLAMCACAPALAIPDI
eukprot:6466764-Amphidinium_carterae.1